MPLTAAASLLDALRATPLLRAVQFSELEREAERFHEARALAQYLLERGWLTPFQVNQLMLERASELVLGPYLLIERLGEGFGGTVYKARHLRMNRTVALRVIRRELLADSLAIQQFYGQVEAASKLCHDNVVHAYDAGPIGETHFLATEYVAGTDLARLVKQTGPLLPAQACDHISQAALGLQHGFEHGLTHGGLKPSKLIVTQTPGSDARVALPDLESSGSGERKRDRPGMVKISDLGLTRLRRAARDDTANVSSYMAPEQLAEGQPVDIRADICALGRILSYLLTGKHPLPGMAIEPAPDLPPPVQSAMQRMVAGNPAERFQTPGEAATALREFVSQCQVTAEVPPLDFFSTGPASGTKVGSQRPAVVEQHRRTAAEHLRLAVLVSLGGAVLLIGTLLARWMLASPAPTRPTGETAPATTPFVWLDGKLGPEEKFLAGNHANLAAVLRQTGAVRAIAFDPKGTTLASAGDDGVIHLWDWASGKPLPTVEGHGKPVLSVAFSPDGQTLASCGKDKKLKLWDMAGRKEKFAHAGATDLNTYTVFDPEGKVIAARLNTKELRLYDLANPKAGTNHKFGDKQIMAFAFRPDGKAIAVGLDSKSVQLWDVPIKKRIGGGETHAAAVRSVAFSPDGKLLASGSDDKTIKLWEAETGKEQTTLKGHTHPVIALAFAPDSQSLASAGSNGQVILWSPTGRVALTEWQLPDEVHDIAFAPDGRHLAAAIGNGAIAIFRVAPK